LLPSRGIRCSSAYNEPLAVTMRVNDPDCSPFGING